MALALSLAHCPALVLLPNSFAAASVALPDFLATDITAFAPIAEVCKDIKNPTINIIAGIAYINGFPICFGSGAHVA